MHLKRIVVVLFLQLISPSLALAQGNTSRTLARYLHRTRDSDHFFGARAMADGMFRAELLKAADNPQEVEETVRELLSAPDRGGDPFVKAAFLLTACKLALAGDPALAAKADRALEEWFRKQDSSDQVQFAIQIAAEWADWAQELKQPEDKAAARAEQLEWLRRARELAAARDKQPEKKQVENLLRTVFFEGKDPTVTVENGMQETKQYRFHVPAMIEPQQFAITEPLTRKQCGSSISNSQSSESGEADTFTEDEAKKVSELQNGRVPTEAELRSARALAVLGGKPLPDCKTAWVRDKQHGGELRILSLDPLGLYPLDPSAKQACLYLLREMPPSRE